MAHSLRLSEEQLAAILAKRRREVAAPVKRVVQLEPSRLEVEFAQQIALLRLPTPVEQFVGAVPGRKYRIDFAWPDRKVAVEVQGMVHRIKNQFQADTEKMCLLVVNGWRVLPVSGDDVRSGRAAQWIETLLSKELPCSK